MKFAFLPIAPIFLVCFACPSQSAELKNHFEIGQRSYESGEFKKAVSQFERAAKADPDDARVYLWLGKSYEMLAIIDGPALGGHARAQAHKALAKAFRLEPENREYRHELFEFLVESDYSRSALREAETIAQTVNESDPDYPLMQARLEDARDEHYSREHRASALLLAPIEFVKIAARPVSLTHPAGM